MFLVNKVYVGVKHFERKRKTLNSIGFKIDENSKAVGCACVTKDVKDGLIVGDVPARVMRVLDDASEN